MPFREKKILSELKAFSSVSIWKSGNQFEKKLEWWIFKIIYYTLQLVALLWA